MLIAVVEKSIHGTAIIPVVTIATLGIVPTTAEEENGYVFSLSRCKRPATD